MVFLGIGLLCVNIVFMVVFYRKISRNFSQSNYLDSVRSEVSKLIVDIQHESDCAITVLENKIQEGKQVLAEIDKHILLVEQEQNKWVTNTETAQSLQVKTAKNSSFSDTEVSVQPAERLPAVQKLKPKPAVVADAVVYKKPVMPVLDIPGMSAREQVIEFGKKGFSVDFISEKVDMPIGEIALILSMIK